MTQSQRIIKKFGGVNPLSRALGHTNPTTVRGWLLSGFIPPRQHDKVWNAAQANGVSLSLADFAAVTLPEDQAEAQETVSPELLGLSQERN
jgi:hypothetical protein